MSTDSQKTLVKVLIVEDMEFVAQGFKSFFNTVDSINVVDICKRGEEVLEAVKRLKPDVVLMDLQLKGSKVDGFEATRQLRQAKVETKVLVLTAFADPAYVFRSLDSGIDGYLLKESSPEQVLDAIHAVFKGKPVVDSEIVRLFRDHVVQPDMGIRDSALTRREWEVVELVGYGWSNQEIATELYIAHNTVKKHVSKILDKLVIDGRQLLMVWYLVHGKDIQPKKP